MVLAQLHHRVADVGDLRGNRIGVDVGVRIVRDELPEGNNALDCATAPATSEEGKANALARAWDHDDVDLPLAAAV